MRKSYGLGEYTDSDQPCIFFGMYRAADLTALIRHNGLAVVRWSGQDALDFKDWDLIRFKNIHHITPFPSVARILSLNGFRCHLTQPADTRGDVQPVTKGNAVYVYCPASAKQYHGFRLVNMLRLPHRIVWGNGKVPQSKWPEVATGVYRKCFIGLVLNNHAGGGASIMEMGLRGIRVVTNVVSRPHTLPWTTADDILRAIDLEVSEIGRKNVDLSNEVKSCLDSEMSWLNTTHYDHL